MTSQEQPPRGSGTEEGAPDPRADRREQRRALVGQGLNAAQAAATIGPVLADKGNQDSFLALIRSGESASSAAAALGITRAAVYQYRDRDSRFAGALQKAMTEGQKARKAQRQAEREAERRSSSGWDYETVSRETGLSVATLRSYKSTGHMPPPDDPAGPSWLPETIRAWRENRPGQGYRSDLNG
ncbi:hypothetical protein [Streptomyces yangpuensis]|uniref:hypothetical protein n=1 Tax=Streptomyces yangpuensis TaxID=1648182 RepID=UPI003656CF67